MPDRGTPPFRADHVGSLLRPAALLKARDDFDAGRASAEERRAAEDDAIRDVVRMQEDLGLALATDGEFRRTSWNMDYLFEMDGIEEDPQPRMAEFSNEEESTNYTRPALRVVDKIGLGHTIFGDHFSFLDEQTTTAMAKISIPSPNMIGLQRDSDGLDIGAYGTAEELWADVTAAYRAEIEGLYALGCRYLQLDDTTFGMLTDPRRREAIAQHGGDGGHQHLSNIERMNAVLSGRPSDMTITTHTCRGNFRSRWGAEGSYDFVAEALFSELDVDGFFLEYDDARSGGFEALRFVPKGKRVVLGLVTSKRPQLESKSDLKRRIDEASTFVDLDQLCISPQCGFSSTIEGNDLSIDQEIAKLRLVVEVAQDVWG